LIKINDADPVLPDEQSVNAIVKDLEQAAYHVTKIKRGVRKRKPSAPFTTSTLQQEASRKLGFTAKRTMTIAQQLYEGLDVGNGGSTGLITYMRTDSTNVASEAQAETRKFIIDKYGKDYVPSKAPQYKTKAKGAQEAHEAVRPTSILRQPEAIKSRLSAPQYKLYQLIWKRFVASQMEAAEYDTLSIDITGVSDQENYLLRTTGSTLRFEGFLAVYEEAKDEDQNFENGDALKIPADIEEGQKQKLVCVLPEQHFTQPPPRFTDASLVKTLEEYGIGRPSTYAAILSTIQDRGYVYREAKRLYPTETGMLVNDLLVNYFSDIVNVNFSAHMEDDLDLIAEGKAEWREIVQGFYNTFEPQLKHAQEEMPEQKAELEKVGRTCPRCNHDLVIRWGRFGKFISCSNFPECRYTEPWLEKIGVTCPECGGDIVRRRTRKGRVFYGCSNYPECQFTSWKEPVSTPCPSCKELLVIANKREVKCLNCEESFLRDQIEIASEKA
jgi:DNA topoisomerase-1